MAGDWPYADTPDAISEAQPKLFVTAKLSLAGQQKTPLKAG
jgi:hypothetical protein